MADGLYAKGREAFLAGDIDWVADTIKMVLVDAADYTVNLTTHQYLSDIPAGGRVATATLGSKTATDGVADAANGTFGTVTGDPCEALVIYKDSGVASTSPLIAYIDSYSGLPVTPNGGEITFAFPDDANKIFKL